MNIVMKIGAMNVMQQEVTTTRDVPMRGRKEIIDIHRVQGMECQHLEQSCVSLEALSELPFFLRF